MPTQKVNEGKHWKLIRIHDTIYWKYELHLNLNTCPLLDELPSCLKDAELTDLNWLNSEQLLYAHLKEF